MTHSNWITLSRELKAIAEAGLRYSDGPYDIQRYQRLHELSSLPMQAAAPDFKWPVEFGYSTPKVDVRAAVIDDQQRILLVQEAASRLWTLPGGWADVNLTPSQNAAKETREESGIEIKVSKLIACWDKDHQGHPSQPEHVYKLVFLCHPVGGKLQHSIETTGAGFFSRSEIPELCPWRAAPHYLDLAWKHHHDPTLPTAFD
ncbi:MAG: NUDIX hydrolase N-terminal domain-containing protein [Verrucomicrobiales bacterium]|nr:NUDIX hydrolase N-terminal domain-containing protein [Verrucomicrobiota bacterium JB025]